MIPSSIPKHIDNVVTAEFHNEAYLFSDHQQYTNPKWYWNKKNQPQLEIQGIADSQLPE